MTTQLNQNKLPLISIITVVLNGVNTIEQTIRSVLIDQSYSNKEYIIIDGGSTDGTLKIIKKYEHQLRYWISEPDAGIFDAMNKGLNQANGDLIGIINADDWYEKDILDFIAEQYLSVNNNTVIHGLLRNYLNEQFYSIKGNSTRVLKYDMIQHPTCFIPKNLYRRLGQYDTHYKYSADYDLFLRFLNHGAEFLFLEKVIANFRIGGISSKPRTQSEKYYILNRNKLISKMEMVLRLTLLYTTNCIKTVAGIQ